MMDDRITSWLRTVVPGLWATLVAFTAAQLAWLPDEVLDWLSSEATVGVVVLAALAAWYGVWRWLEPRIPAWLRRMVLGSARAPAYASVERSDPPATADGTTGGGEGLNGQRQE